LTGQQRAQGEPGEPRHGFSPLPHRGEAVSNEMIDRLREDEPE
jgi:hypothetical protein